MEGRGMLWAFAWMNWEKPQKPPVRKADLWAKIRTRDLPNIEQQYQPHNPTYQNQWHLPVSCVEHGACRHAVHWSQDTSTTSEELEGSYTQFQWWVCIRVIRMKKLSAACWQVFKFTCMISHISICVQRLSTGLWQWLIQTGPGIWHCVLLWVNTKVSAAQWPVTRS